MKEIDLGVMQKNAEKIIATARKLMKRPDKRGGYVCIATRTGKALAIFLVGTVANETKAAIYRGYCHEKAQRLGNNLKQISSWESRDEATHRYGGAIRVGELIFSFSAFPEHWDEACMVALANMSGHHLSMYVMQKIREISDNPHSALLLRTLIPHRKIPMD